MANQFVLACLQREKEKFLREADQWNKDAIGDPTDAYWQYCTQRALLSLKCAEVYADAIETLKGAKK